MKPNDITHATIGAAIDVHRVIGPGQDEVVYEDALEVALQGRGIRFHRQKPLPVHYKGVKLDCGFRPDFVIEETVVAECKAVELMHPVFEAQVRTYQRLGGWPLGLLLNFNVPVMKEGVARFIVNANEFRQEGRFSAEIRRTQRERELTEAIIGAAIEVHRHLGPGLLHSVYSACLRHELTLAELTFEAGRRLEVTFQGAKLGHSVELDLVVAGQVLVAARYVPKLLPIDEAQVRSQMHLGNLPAALLLNFHARRLIDDLKRFGCLEPSVSSKTLCSIKQLSSADRLGGHKTTLPTEPHLKMEMLAFCNLEKSHRSLRTSLGMSRPQEISSQLATILGGSRSEQSPFARIAGCVWILAFYSWAGLLIAAPSAPAKELDVFLNLRARPLEYHGPDKAGTNLTGIRIAWFGPANETNHIWWAANLAISDHSRENPGGVPVKLLPCWSADPWSGGAATLAKTIYTEQPLAVIGGPDSASTHLAEQIAAKANLPLVSPITTDPSVTLAGVPWMFSCAPSDRAIAKTLVEHVLLHAGLRRSSASARRDGVAPPEEGRFALLSGTDHESRMTAREIMGECSRRGRLPDLKLDLQPGAEHWLRQLNALAEADPSSILVIASSEDAAKLVPEIRRRLPKAMLIGSHMLSRSTFIQSAGAAAEGVCCPILFQPNYSQPEVQRFTDRFRAVFGITPDYTAAFTYDAVWMLLEAALGASDSRSQVLASLRLSSYRGISGEIRFDGTGQNTRADIRMGVIQNGIVVPVHDPQSQACANNCNL